MSRLRIARCGLVLLIVVTGCMWRPTSTSASDVDGRMRLERSPASTQPGSSVRLTGTCPDGADGGSASLSFVNFDAVVPIEETQFAVAADGTFRTVLRVPGDAH